VYTSVCIFLPIQCNQVVARGHYSAMRRSQHVHWLRFRELYSIGLQQMFVSNPVRDRVTCDTYSQLHLHGVMTNICKQTKKSRMRTLCEYAHAYIHVNICTHTCQLGVHTSLNLVYMYVNIYTHTCSFCVYICRYIHTKTCKFSVHICKHIYRHLQTRCAYM